MQYIKSSNDYQAEPARNSTYAQRDRVAGMDGRTALLVYIEGISGNSIHICIERKAG